MDFTTLLMKMVMLMLLIIVGYVCARLKITDKEFNNKITPVMMNIFLPATIINSLAAMNGDTANREVFVAILWAFIVFILAAILAFAVTKLFGMNDEFGRVSVLTVTFPNNGFVGLPMVELIFGSGAVFFASLTNIPFNVLIYPMAAVLIGSAEGRKIPIKQIFSAPLISTLLVIVLFLFRLQLPDVLADTVSTIAGATVPVSMIIIGTSLGAVSLRELFGDRRIYVLALTRLILCPLASWGLMKLLGCSEYLTGIMVCISACPSAMVPTVLCIQHGKDPTLASKTAFVTTLFSVVTMPLMVSLLL